MKINLRPCDIHNWESQTFLFLEALFFINAFFPCSSTGLVWVTLLYSDFFNFYPGTRSLSSNLDWYALLSDIFTTYFPQLTPRITKVLIRALAIAGSWSITQGGVKSGLKFIAFPFRVSPRGCSCPPHPEFSTRWFNSWICSVIGGRQPAMEIWRTHIFHTDWVSEAWEGGVEDL